MTLLTDAMLKLSIKNKTTQMRTTEEENAQGIDDITSLYCGDQNLIGGIQACEQSFKTWVEMTSNKKNQHLITKVL